MRANHIRVFMKAALEFGCEIVVREQNPLSAQYMGRSGFKPKPIWCHAKTAGNTDGPKALQGLVVDPTLFEAAFEKAKLADAILQWKEFETHYLKHGMGFKKNEVKDSPHYGCVLFHGDYLYSDYDLKSVTPYFGENPVLTSQKGNKGEPPSPGVPPIDMKHHPNAPIDYKTGLESNLAQFFSERTGIALIQHGAEKNIPGFKSSTETCDVFLPCSPFHTKESRNG